MATGKDVTRKLEAIWPDLEARRQVQSELERYGEEPHEREVARVRLAILKVCAGQLERVAALVVAAKQDFRDVLLCAEYPSQAQALWTLKPRLSQQERRQLEDLQEQDRKQYEEWLKR